ncbi:hypothetical protein ACJJTC_010387 [Scirpophaga incertulas]
MKLVTVLSLIFSNALMFCLAAVGVSSKSVIEVRLSESITTLDKELYKEFVHINASSTIQFNIVNDVNVSFIVFQVHSHVYNVTLYNNTNIEGSSVSGKNVGLYSSVRPKLDTFFLLNPNIIDLKLFVSVQGYGNKDPIPGGCNMEFPTPISPFMRTTFLKDYIFVDAAAPRYYTDMHCQNIDNVVVDFYIMYLPEHNFDSETYFDGIQKMMTLEKIIENGDRIPKTAFPMRRMLSAYPGTGAIYVAVAKDVQNPNYYSIYVPNHHYACMPFDDGDDSCEIIQDVISKLICASLIFLGLFTCYIGHRFFKTEMFLFGVLSGVVVSYILISIMSDLDRPALLLAATSSGVLVGILWLIFWWYYGLPIIAVSLPALNLGFLIASIVYSKLPGDVVMLQVDYNFWTLFVLIMTLTCVFLVSMAFVTNVLCCAVLGAYAVVYALDFYVGSNLKYIIINIVRRATVPKFGMAVLMVPFEWKDALMIALWVGLAISGFLWQHFHNRGRPPFPPPPRGGCINLPYYGTLSSRLRDEVESAPSDSVQTQRISYNENTPLLADSTNTNERKYISEFLS